MIKKLNLVRKGKWRVTVDGETQSSHNEEKEGIEQLIEHTLARPDAEVELLPYTRMVADIELDVSTDPEPEQPEPSQPDPDSDTPLGLLHDARLLQRWRTKASRDVQFNATVPDEWARIDASVISFMGAPGRDRVHALPVNTDGVDSALVMREHIQMLDTAFFALVEQRHDLAGQIIDELMWHGARLDHTARAPIYRKTDDGNWWPAAWLTRILMCADLVAPFEQDNQLDQFRRMIAIYAHDFAHTLERELGSVFPGRTRGDYTSSHPKVVSDPDYNAWAYRDADGNRHNQISSVARRYNNRKSMLAAFVGLAGVYLSDQTLIDAAVRYLQEWVRFSVFADGSTGEWERNDSRRSIRQGLNYDAHNLSAYVMVGLATALRGDTRLLEYETDQGIWGTEGATRSWLTVVDMHARVNLDQTELYYAGQTPSARTRLSAQPEGEAYRANDLWYMPLVTNMQFREKKDYQREYGKPLGAAGPFGGPWRGGSAQFPSVLLMFA